MISSVALGSWVLVAIALGATGCRSIQAPTLIASTHEPASVNHVGAVGVEEIEESTEESVSRWPTRWGGDPENHGIIIELDRPWSEFRSAHLGRTTTLRSSEIEYHDANQLAGALGKETGFRFKAEGPGSFVFVPRVSPKVEETTKPEPEMAFKFVSAQVVESDDDAESVRIERTWFTFRQPEDPDALIGTVVLLPGMFGTPVPVIDGFESYLNTRGWATLRMMSHPSGFTGHLVVPVDDESAFSASKMIAKEYDQRTAECAYATRGALRHVRDSHPGLKDLPTNLIGMSGGAMVLPSVYAFDPSSYDAAVLIAGGVNSMLISAISNYQDMIDAVRLDFDGSTPEIDGELDRELLQKMSKIYQMYAQLDAVRTAKEMGGIPILQLHATRDKAVPAKSGDLLYEQLGRPERWTYPVGHELIFAALPLQVPKIHQWMVDALGSGPTAEPTP